MTNLDKYNKKRNFNKTSEPKGNKKNSNRELIFVVQHHLARKDHYDFRLEHNGVLKSWAVPKGPSFNPKDKRLAIQVEDHPFDYKDFEGTIPQGEYGGGTVMIWDEGTYTPILDMDQGLKKGSIKFSLNGSRLKGNWALVKLHNEENENNWLLIKEKDEYTKDIDGISKYTKSVRTNRTMKQISENKNSSIPSNPFDRVEVALAKLVNEVPNEKDWLYEIKYDGYRIISFIDNKKIRLVTRNHNDYTSKFNELIDPLKDISKGHSMVLDGEAVVIDDQGRSDFQALQGYLKNPNDQNLCYVIFDILAYDGEDLRDIPLIKRKQTLEKILKNSPKSLIYSTHVEGQGKACLKVAFEKNLEGIIGKKKESVYTSKRNGDWIKIKCIKGQEFVIGGYTLSTKRDTGISSLLLGVYEEDQFIYVGRAGGFSKVDMDELESKTRKLIRKSSPFTNTPKPQNGETLNWLKPELIAEIKFAEWTSEGLLRQAKYKGLRSDKIATSVKKETPIKNKSNQNSKSEKIILTSPDKIMYPKEKVTKKDIADYYQKVSERMLPYLQNRLISVIRYPQGVGKEGFFKKHLENEMTGIKLVDVTNSKNETETYYSIIESDGIMSEVQMNTIEFHIWGSHIKTLEKPDMMVFDLDPDEKMELKQVRQGVKDLKIILDELNLTSYLKTSGGKGYHIVVPFKPTSNWDNFSEFAKNVAILMEDRWPDRYTSNIRKNKRDKKIFIDWIRNTRSATSVAPYSLRAKEKPTVSMPIAWNELNKIAPNQITMQDAIKRLKKKDPWDGFTNTNQKLK